MTGLQKTEVAAGIGSLRAGLKRLIPPSLLRLRLALGQVSFSDGLALMGWLANRRVRPRRWREPMSRARAVAFICQGNIIRSPFAAAVFSRDPRIQNRGIEVLSFGVGAKPAERADERAVRAAAEFGVDLRGHHAQLADARLARCDMIFAMDFRNIARLAGGYPELADRFFLLGGCQPDGSTTLAEIYDPVMGTVEDVRRAHDQVLKRIELILKDG